MKSDNLFINIFIIFEQFLSVTGFRFQSDLTGAWCNILSITSFAGCQIC